MKRVRDSIVSIAIISFWVVGLPALIGYWIDGIHGALNVVAIMFAIGFVSALIGLFMYHVYDRFPLFSRSEKWIREHVGFLLTGGLLIFLMNTEDTDAISYLALIGAFVPALFHMWLKSDAKRDEARHERQHEIQESKNEIDTLHHELSEANAEHERTVQTLKNTIIDLESEIEVLEYKLREEESLG